MSSTIPQSARRETQSRNPVPDDYRRVIASAGSYRHFVSFLRLTGNDVPDFLHRMSTNDLAGLTPGETRKTVLVNEKGRIIDIVQACKFPDATVLVGSGDNGGRLRDWLEKFIIMEDITVTIAEDKVPVLYLLGPDIPAVLRGISADYDPGHTGSFAPIEMAGHDVIVYRDDSWRQPSFTLVFPDSGEEIDSVVAAARSTGLLPAGISPETFETLRIEEGIPLLGRELTPGVNALEAGLKKYISFSKGCYIGQEVIARLDTYNKLQRLLSLFSMPGTDLQTFRETGKVFLGDQEAGRITSSCYSPRYSGVVGLGYRRKGFSGERAVFVPDGSDRRIPVTLLESTLPGYELYEVSDEKD